MIRSCLVMILLLVGTCGIARPLDSLHRSAVYRCPPCGCSADNQVFSAPGRCPQCKMPLLQVTSGVKQDLRDEVGVIFQYSNHYTNLYLRIIYPLMVFGGLIAVLLLIARPNIRSGFLALFLLSLVLYMLKFQLYGTRYAVNTSRQALFLPISFFTLTWPAIYFFVRSSLKREFPSFSTVLLHFAPALLLWFGQWYLFLTYPRSEHYLFNWFDTILNPIEQLIFVGGALVYGRLIYQQLFKGRHPMNGKEKGWVISLLIFPYLIAATCLFLLVLNGYLFSFLVSTLDYHLLWLVMTIPIPWYAYLIFLRREEFPGGKETVKYRLAAEKMDLYATRVRSIMETEKPYLNPSFSLNDFAHLMDVSEKEMSEILKRGCDANFYNFVNQYRVNACKAMLIDPKYSHLTNFAIAEMAGFRSRSTFIHHFKKLEGMTPKAYQVSFTTDQGL